MCCDRRGGLEISRTILQAMLSKRLVVNPPINSASAKDLCCSCYIKGLRKFRVTECMDTPMYGLSLPGYSPWVWVLLDFNRNLYAVSLWGCRISPWSTMWVALDQDTKMVVWQLLGIDRFSLVVDRGWTPHVFIPRFGCLLVQKSGAMGSPNLGFRGSINKCASVSTGATRMWREHRKPQKPTKLLLVARLVVSFKVLPPKICTHRVGFTWLSSSIIIKKPALNSQPMIDFSCVAYSTWTKPQLMFIT